MENIFFIHWTQKTHNIRRIERIRQWESKGVVKKLQLQYYCCIRAHMPENEQK
jgi:hypothetical protein